jgi:hypothetical protein
MKQADKIDAKAPENASRRIGLQDRLKEDVKITKHDQGALNAARQRRFDTTGEPSTAPCYEDAE